MIDFLLRYGAIIGTGIYAGQAIQVYSTTIPSILKFVKTDSHTSLRFWREMMLFTSTQMAVFSIIGGFCGGLLFWHTKNLVWLLSALLIFGSYPFKQFVLNPQCNIPLFSIYGKLEREDQLLVRRYDQKIESLISRWRELHFIRMCATSLAFFLTLPVFC
eukprot:gene4506-5619_t